MIFSENEYDRMNYLMTAIMDAGELLAMHGAEVSRVEDTITRLCMAYGFVRADVFTITSSIIAVSYTHLDVYKRQNMGLAVLP